MIKIRFFARLKEIVGRGELELPHAQSLHAVLEQIKKEFPELSEWISDGKVLISVNQEMADASRPVKDGDEIGIMPPFSGGALPWGLPDRIRIMEGDFDLPAEIQRIKSTSGRIGAVVGFVGTVRDFSEDREIEAIYSEHYPGMAEKYLLDLRKRALMKFDVTEIYIFHRVGMVYVKSDILCLLVASERRPAAFEACQWCVEELKQTIPIWKRELTPNGTRWVGQSR